MTLDPAVRQQWAAAVVAALEQSAPESRAGLRGSLAGGFADCYSDIDVFWEVPDELFLESVEELGETLSSVGAVESVRSDPALQNSDKRQLIFVQFAEVPLYWRVDIEVYAESIGMDPTYDLGNPDARGDEWSRPHSALTNAVAALKYLLRGNEGVAEDLLRRAFERVDLPMTDAPLWDQVRDLTEIVGRRDLEQAELVRRVQLLHRDALAQRDGATRSKPNQPNSLPSKSSRLQTR